MKHSNRFSSLLVRVIKSVLADEVYTSLPGKIERIIDAKKRKISVKPGIIKQYLDKQEISLPVIENVPLIIPGNDKHTFAIPFAVGDKVFISFSQRSLDFWLSNGYESLPGDTRKFSINDAVAFLGLNAFDEDIPLLENNTDFGIIKENSKIIIKDNDDIIINNEKFTFELNNDGSFSVDNGNGNINMAVNGKVSINGTNLTVEP